MSSTLNRIIVQISASSAIKSTHISSGKTTFMEHEKFENPSQMNTLVNDKQDPIPLDNNSVPCPKCNKLFSLETTENNLSSHMTTCALILQNNPILQANNSNLIDETIPMSEIKSTQKGSEPFIWVKKQMADKNFVWEKQKLSNGIGDGILGELMMEEIAALGFEDKRKWFRNGLELFRIPWIEGADYLRIERSKLLESSVKAMTDCLLFKEVKIEFVGDEKVNDAGGLMREWMSLIIKELVKPDLGLFVTTDTEEVSYSINPKALNTEEVLELYEFAGKVVGKAIFERITLNMHFDHCLLRALTGRDIKVEDLKTLDTPLYNSLMFLQQTTLGGCDIFQEYFVVPDREQKIELCEKGAEKLVTDANKHEYIRLMVEWYGKKRVEKKVKAFINGLASCIPTETLLIFEPHELEMIISGAPFIDIDDWEANTIYRGSYSSTHEVICWFWKTLRKMSQEELAQLLQYCTGSPRTPVEGFRALESNRGDFARFCIESSDFVKGSALITAHTCFNRLVLPTFPDEESIKRELFAAIRSEFEGVFGLD